MNTSETNPGGGSGGGITDPHEHSRSYDGEFKIAARTVEMMSRPPVPPATPGPNIISLLATDLVGMGEDGTVDVKGAKGVRITAGPPLLVPSHSESTNGVEVATGETQNVTITRGLIPGVDQQIEMTPAGITIDGGACPITIKSLTEITLSVAGGLSTITLTPAGITIQGVIIQIN
jgi:hypothetical protein